MAVPSTKVYITFALVYSPTNFTLNDTVKGLLDSATYVLAGDVFVDVTQYVASVSINRGKSRELDRYTAGGANVTLHNDTRVFDPFNTASPYYTQILPRKQIIIETNGVRVFTGIIDDWDLTYDISGKSFASVTAVDGFLNLTAAEIDSFTATSQLSSDRITAILDRGEVAWPSAQRSIQTGLTTLQADLIPENTNALQYLQLVETTENGKLFIDRSGLLTFKNRTVTPPASSVVFSDTSTANAIPYTNIGVVYGSENLYNRVTITRLSGTPQVADALTSQSSYGVSAFSLDGLLLDSDDESLNLANYLVGLYDEPELRINEISVNLHDKTSAQVTQICSAEITDLVQIIFTPNQVGSAITQDAVIIGIKQDIGIDQHKITFQLEAIGFVNFILDSASYGLLDTNILAY